MPENVQPNTIMNIQSGDITKSGADAIIVPQFSGGASYGGVGGAVDRSGAQSGMAAYDTHIAANGEAAFGSVLLTPSGGGASPYLMHVTSVGSGVDEFQTIKNSMFNALKLAEQKGVSSLSAPALGTGIAGRLTPEQSAQAMMGAVHDYLQQGGKPIPVSFFIYGDQTAEAAFKEVLESESYKPALTPESKATSVKTEALNGEILHPELSTDKVSPKAPEPIIIEHDPNEFAGRAAPKQTALPPEIKAARIVRDEALSVPKGLSGVLRDVPIMGTVAAIGSAGLGAAMAEPGHRLEGAADGLIPGMGNGFKDIKGGGPESIAATLEAAAPILPIATTPLAGTAVAAGVIGAGAGTVLAVVAAPAALAAAAVIRGDIAAKKEAVVTQFTKHLPKHSDNPEIQKLIDQHNALKAQEAKTFVGEGHNRYRIEHNRGAHPQYDAYNQMDKAYHEAVQNFAAEHPAEYAAHINNQTPLAQPTAQPATPAPTAPQFTAPTAAPPMATMPLSPYNQARAKQQFTLGELKTLQAAESGHATKQQNRDVQKILESHGYDTGNKNRTAYAFGPLDGTGAEKYDGIVGQQTRASLKQASHSEPTQDPTTQPDAPKPTAQVKTSEIQRPKASPPHMSA